MAKYTTEEFISLSKEANKHLDYDYSLTEYKGQKYKVKIICLRHNITFEQVPRSVLLHAGCPKCSVSGKATKEMFIEKAIKVHGNKYNYDNFNYINNKVKGEIKCNDCNHIWFIRPDNHINLKNGCPNCKNNSIYTKEYYIKNNIPNHECYLYFIEINKDSETYLKIGITKHSNIVYRFRGSLKQKDFNLIYTFKTDFFTAYEKEQELLSKYLEYKFIPKIKIKGWTECLSLECKSSLITDFNNLLSP